MATTTIRVAVYTNSDDAFVAWAPSAFIPGCRGFLLERARRAADGTVIVEEVANRVGFAGDEPKSGEERPSSEWPFQRFNWTDHASDVGHEVRFRVTAMVDGGGGRPWRRGPASRWSRWAKLSADAGSGFSCYFNRGLVLSQFVARYLRDRHLAPVAFKAQLKAGADPVFRAFLEGDLGARLAALLADAAASKAELHAALYELDDARLEAGLIALGGRLHLVLSNGSNAAGDGNQASRARLKAAGLAVVDRLLGNKGLGHNKFAVLSDARGPRAAWTGSTNWTTTGLCTQINNGLLIEDRAVAAAYRAQWQRLADASPPALVPAGFPPSLVAADDAPQTFSRGRVKTTLRFTRTSGGADMQDLRDLVNSAKTAILFLMFTPGKDGLHTLAAQRAREPAMYVRGVVSTFGTAAGDGDRNVLDVGLVSSDRVFKPDRYSVIQPQGLGAPLGAWIAEVTRRDFLSQVGHAIVHSKVLVIDPLSDAPVVVTGSHNFSTPASKANDENFVVVRGHRALAAAYAAHVMSVYQHYRFRAYVREVLAQGGTPWSHLDDDDRWLQKELKSKAQEIGYWA